MLIAAGLVVLGALAGGAGAMLAGAVQSDSGTRTVIESTPATTSLTLAPAGPWTALYARAAAGTIDLTVGTTTTLAPPLGGTLQRETVMGSGFVLDSRGDLVTAAHVVGGASSIQVTFQNGSVRTATVIDTDYADDVAFLHVDPHGLALHPLLLGSSRGLAAGDALAMIGDPLGFNRSLSTGVVSGVDRTVESPNGYEIAHAIQTDAAMNPGDSGGPLFDSTGRVVGIADQIATGVNRFGDASSDTNTGVGFAVPVEVIKAELVRLTSQATRARSP